MDSLLYTIVTGIIHIFMLITIPTKMEKRPDAIIVYNHLMPWASAMTVGNVIYTKKSYESMISPRGIALYKHELVHVRQWQEAGWKFPFLYVIESYRAWRRGQDSYSYNKYEVEAYNTEYKYMRDHQIPHRNRYVNPR